MAYKYASQKITGKTDSGLEQTLDALYFSAEITSACATGTMSIQGSIAAVKSISPAKMAGRWIAVDGFIKYEFYMTANVSAMKAGGVVITEALSTTMSGISFFSSPNNNFDTVNFENGNRHER